ncbi:MAG: MFS transporter [Actinomycetota bacterium]|nr:MFS transporter [Actinomycetota bacterium]
MTTEDLPDASGSSDRRSVRWRTRNVWAISLSAFFSDTGYQAVWAGFPLFLVLELHQPVWEFGLASALAYGGGTLFAWLGALLGDRIGHRRVAIGGNALIPLLSLSALWANPAVAIGLLCAGWWARNLRTPSRRVMLVEAAPDEADRSSVFGFLHALDIGGGALAGVYVLIAVIEHVAFSWIFLASVLPLAAATFSLTLCSTGRAVSTHVEPSDPAPSDPEPSESRRTRLPGAAPLLAASALFGFTYYSVGFPILTTAQGSGDRAFGIGAFLLFNAVSAATGYLMGPRLGSGIAERFRALGAFGYLFAVVGAVLLAVGAAAHLTVGVLLVGVAALGFSLGVVTTVEPTLMSVLRPGRAAGRGFGALGAARSAGLFFGNLIMGLLYARGAGWAYGYAAVMGIAATIVVLGAIPAARRADGRVRSQARMATDEQ